jgi:malate/lactate dehydrogenase
MGVMSDGSYGIRPGVIYSQPVTIKDGVITIVHDLNIDEFSRQKMNATSEELVGVQKSAQRLSEDEHNQSPPPPPP